MTTYIELSELMQVTIEERTAGNPKEFTELVNQFLEAR